MESEKCYGSTSVSKTEREGSIPSSGAMNPREDLREVRVRARLAWNGWPDTEESRKRIAEQEARDSYSACSWDRVIEAIRAA